MSIATAFAVDGVSPGLLVTRRLRAVPRRTAAMVKHVPRGVDLRIRASVLIAVYLTIATAMPPALAPLTLGLGGLLLLGLAELGSGATANAGPLGRPLASVPVVLPQVAPLPAGDARALNPLHRRSAAPPRPGSPQGRLIERSPPPLTMLVAVRGAPQLAGASCTSRHSRRC